MKRLLYFMALLLALGTVVTSCGKDDGPETDINADDPNDNDGDGDNDDDNNDGNNDDDNNGDGDTDTTLSITELDLSGSVGDQITITGENFGDDANAITVTFGGDVTVDGVTLDGNTITLNVPEGAIDGPLTVTIGDQSATSTEEFDIVIPDPLFNGPSLFEGYVGTEVKILYGNLPTNLNLITVTFGGVEATEISLDGQETLVATVPEGVAYGELTVNVAVDDFEYEFQFTVRPNTYAVGYQENDMNTDVATLWINGEAISLSNSGESSRANGVDVEGDFAYVAGKDNDLPKLWTVNLANGNTVAVDDLPLDTDDGEASSVVVYTNGDIHIAGQQYSNFFPLERKWLYWKKEGSVTKTELSPQDPDGTPDIFTDVDLAIANGNVYFIGYEGVPGPFNDYLNVWKDGLIDETLSKSGQSGASRFRSIAVGDDDTVYIAGQQESDDPALWVNGLMLVLSDSGDAREVFVEGTDHYVAGRIPGNHGYWENGTFIPLEVDGSPYVDTIFVHEGIVYLGGDVGNPNRATLWVDGEPMTLGAEGTESRVRDLFVR